MSTYTTTTTAAAVSHSSASLAPASPPSVPRPLQLLDVNLPSIVSSPTTTSSPQVRNPLYGLGLSTPPPSAQAFKSPNPRRQSSISYFSSDHVSHEGRLPAKGKVPRRSHSMGVWGNALSGVSKVKGNRRSLGDVDTSREPLSPRSGVDHGPLTLTEKHADLLQFIAQKEAKCMELRSQLAVHESELGQLKKKWERIVSRGMDRAYSSHPSTSPSSSSTAPVTAVSSLIPTANAALKEGVRFIAAGLELSPPTASSHSPSSPILSPPAIPISGLATVSRASLASVKKASARHATTVSVSSVATTSSSSASASTQSQRLSQSSASSLTSSLSFDEALEAESGGAPARTGPSPILEEKCEDVVKPVQVSHGGELLRRRSHEAQEAPPAPSQPASGAHSTTRKQPKACPHPVATSRASLGPPSSTPASPMTSLMTSVGRKWEEIQRGPTFTKSQKRASLLLSDVSQSIFAALASPAPTQAPVVSKPAVKLQETKSLLEEDDMDGGDEKQLGDVLVPSVLSPTPLSAPPATQSVTPAQTPKSATDDDDDDWNW